MRPSRERPKPVRRHARACLLVRTTLYLKRAPASLTAMALVDFKTVVAKWIAKAGVIDEQQASPHATLKDRVVLDVAASASLRSGKARAAHRVSAHHAAGAAIRRQLRARTSRGVLRQMRLLRGRPLHLCPPPPARAAGASPSARSAFLTRIDPQGMHKLLTTVYEEAGLPFPVPAASMNKGEDPAGRLANWNALLAPMQKTFAITLTADEKALLVAGDSEVLEHVIELVHSRGAAGHQDTVRRLAQNGTKKRWARQFDADNVSHVLVTIAQAAGVYACVMASLLSIFVPQWCPGNERDPAEHVCTTYGASCAVHFALSLTVSLPADNFHELSRQVLSLHALLLAGLTCRCSRCTAATTRASSASTSSRCFLSWRRRPSSATAVRAVGVDVSSWPACTHLRAS